MRIPEIAALASVIAISGAVAACETSPSTPTSSVSGATTTAASGGVPAVVSFTSGIPTCKNATDTTALVTLFWRSTNASSVWIASYPNAEAAGDPRTTPKAHGPLPPNASLNVAFNCAKEANPNEFTIGAYGGGGSARKNILVKRNF